MSPDMYKTKFSFFNMLKKQRIIIEYMVKLIKNYFI